MNTKPPVLAGLLLAAFTTIAYSTESDSAHDVVVSRGDALIEFADIDARVSRIPPDKRAGFMDDPERIDKSVGDLLLARQIANEARATGMHTDPVVAAELKLLEDELLAKRQVVMWMRSVKFPDFETVARERYLTNPEQFRTQEVLSVRHFLITRDKHGDEGAKKLAEQRRREFVSSGRDFEAFVAEFSEEPSAATAKGMIQSLIKGKAAGDFEAAAFAINEPGDLSPVISTRFGYHFIQLIHRDSSVLPPYEKVRERITTALRSEFLDRERQRYLGTFEAREMEADPDRVLSLRTRYLEGNPGAKAIKPFEPNLGE